MKLADLHGQVNVGRSTNPGELIASSETRARVARAGDDDTFPQRCCGVGHLRESRLLRVKSVKNVHAAGTRDLTIGTASTARC
jgi:hypothetical protein